jgi:hypothetical protein
VAGVAISGDEVAQLVTFVAPGFLARLGYRSRFPAPERPAGEVLIISVVASLPLVALVQAALAGAQRPTQVGYVVVLLLVSFSSGYLLAVARGKRWAKRMLARAEYQIEPEGSIYAQTLKKMSPDAPVTVETLDGRRISGTPRNGPETKDDGINELYLTHPCAMDEAGEWRPVGAGVILPLDQVASIVLSEDPTGAPVQPAPGSSEPVAEANGRVER